MRKPKIIIPIIFAIIGTWLLVSTFATSSLNAIFFEAESSQGITKTADTNASNGYFIDFKEPAVSGTTGGGTTGGNTSCAYGPSWINGSCKIVTYSACDPLNESAQTATCFGASGGQPRLVEGTAANDYLDLTTPGGYWNVKGGAGDDVLVGDGSGAQWGVYLYGGAGKDTFVINRGIWKFAIMDFEPGEKVYFSSAYPVLNNDYSTKPAYPIVSYNQQCKVLETTRNPGEGVSSNFRPKMSGFVIAPMGAVDTTQAASGCGKIIYSGSVTESQLRAGLIVGCAPFKIQRSWIDIASMWPASWGGQSPDPALSKSDSCSH